MPYQANRDATISKVIGTTRNAEGEKVAHYESVTYPEGAIVFEQDIAPHVLRRLEEGDDHLSSLLRYVDDAEARQILGQQAQEAASQPTDEAEVLHQEERMGAEASNSPAVGPEFEAPEFESPPAGKGDSGAETGEIPEEETTEDVQTTDEGSGTTDDEATAEEASEGVSESEGSTTEETNEVEQQTDAEAAESSSDEAQEDGQNQSNEDQQETEQSSEPDDEFAGLNKKALLEKAKEAKIPGRTKMDEDQLRSALREKTE